MDLTRLWLLTDSTPVSDNCMKLNPKLLFYTVMNLFRVATRVLNTT